MVLQQDVPLGKQGRVELRSVLEGPYWDHNTNTAIKDALYVANGAKHGPQVRKPFSIFRDMAVFLYRSYLSLSVLGSALESPYILTFFHHILQ